MPEPRTRFHVKTTSVNMTRSSNSSFNTSIKPTTILNSELEERIQSFKGNAPRELKEHLARFSSFSRSTFGLGIWKRAKITEVDVDTYESGSDSSGKGEVKEVARVVHELDVEEGECSL
jgi:hypothetical protein